MINYGKHKIDDDDISAVLEVLKSDFLTMGPKVPEFEQDLKKICGASYCTVVTNATAALHLSMIAFGIEQNDHVWTTPVSFVATANAGRYVGAKISFVDIDPTTFNISPENIEKKLLKTKKSEYPKAIVFVHLGGNPTKLIEVHKICKKYGILLIEDASHALGSMAQGSLIGACKYSDATIFSFHPVKMITTGEGGAVLTNSKLVDRRLKLLRSHGINRELSNNSSRMPPWYYEQIELGYNYRVSDLQAAIGISQLKKLNTFVSRRNELANVYFEELQSRKIQVQFIETGHLSSYHLFIVRFCNKYSRNTAYETLLKLDIKCNLHYIPIYKFPYYVKEYGRQDHRFPNAEAYFNTALTLPLYVDLKTEQITNICKLLNV